MTVQAIASSKPKPGPCIEIIDAEMATVLAGKSELERLRIGWGMWRSARNMMVRLLRSEYPDWSAEQIAAEAARRLASGT